MSKQSIKIILITSIIIGITMFGIFKNLYSQTDNQEFSLALKNGAILVDVRTPGEFAGGNVAGAINIPLDQISSNVSKFDTKETVVVFCRGGSRSAQAKSILNQRGIIDVINGGNWQNVNKNISINYY